MDRYDGYDDDAYDGDDIYVEPPEGDAVEHLWNAAHELLRAVRMVVDAADEFVSSQRAAMTWREPGARPSEAGPRVRRIDIDGLDDDAGATRPPRDDRWSDSTGGPGAAPR